MSECHTLKHVCKITNRQIQKFNQYQPGGDTFSFFCDSGEQLEILNFLPDNQDLGHTACRYAKPGSPKRCLPVPLSRACQERQGIRHRSVRCHSPEAENLEFLTVCRRNRKRKKCLRPASGNPQNAPAQRFCNKYTKMHHRNYAIKRKSQSSLTKQYPAYIL